MRRHYKLGENGLEEYTTVINDGVCEMPVMLAYHTTFNLDFYGDMQNVKLQVPVTQEYLRDKKLFANRRNSLWQTARPCACKRRICSRKAAVFGVL